MSYNPQNPNGSATSANSGPVVIASDQASIPVAATLSAETTKVLGVTRTADGAGNLLTSTTNALDVNIKSGNATTITVTQVTGTNLHTVVDSGTITANAGTNLNTSALALDATLTNRTQKGQITDGTRDGTVKAASTAAAATDTALVVAISPNNTVAVSGITTSTPLADVSSTGTLTAAAQTVVLALAGQSAGTAQITGTWVGTITFEGYIDSLQTWTSINAVSASTSAPQTTTTTNGLYRLTPGGLTQFRANMSAFTSGSAVVTLKASVGVGGTFVNQILPSKITDGTSTAAIKAASTAAAATDAALVVAISPNNTVPVSAASLPLPTGAATSALQSTQDTSINSLLKPASTLTAVTTVGSVTAITNALPTGANVIGQVTANAGTNLNTSALALDATLTGRTQKSQVTDGTRDGTVKAASTAAVATDTALVVAISPNNTVPVSLTTVSTTTDTSATGNLTALNSTVALTTNGVGTGIFEITGTWVGTITFQGSNNNFSTSQAISAVYLGGIQTQGSTTTTNGYFSVITAGFAKVQAIMTAYTSGTATVLANGSSADRIIVPVQGNPNNNQTLSSQADTNVTGTISATDVLGGTPGGAGVLINTAPTASSFVAAAVPGGTAQADIQITGTATGTYYFEGSMDSTTGSDGNWIATNYRQTGITNTVLGYSTTTAGIYRGAPSGFKYVRVRNIGGTTPSNPIIFRYSNGGGTTFLNASIPAGTNTIGQVTANAGTNLNTSALALDATLTGGTQQSKITDGTNIATVKAASTAAVATDKALVVAISPNNSLTTSPADLTATGSITTQNLVPAGAATAGSAVTITGLAGMATASVQVTGTYTGALSAQSTVDGTNWVTLGGTPFLNINTGAYSATITSATVGIFQVDVAAFKQFRITGLAAMTGTAVVSIQTSNGAGMVALDAPLPAGANIIGALSANQSANIAQLAGTATDTNSGVKSAGTLRIVLATDQPQLTNKLLVTPDSVALPANQSVNMAQVGGTTTVTGGVAGILAVGGNVANAVTATANPVPVGGVFTTAPATLTTGQTGTMQFTAAQNIKNDITTIAGTAPTTVGKLDVKGADGDVFVRQTTGTNLHVVSDSGSTTAVTQSTATNLNAAVVGTGTAGTPAGNILTIQGVAAMTKLLVTPDSIALPANQSVNVSQVNGITVLTGTGATGTGSQRVTVAVDSATVGGSASLPAGTNLIGKTGIDQTTVGTTNGVTLVPATTGGLTTYHLVSAATTNPTNIKASAGQVYGWYIYNSNAAARKVAFHNSASAPTAGASIFYALVIPPASGANVFSDVGIPFSAGIGITTVTDLTDAGTTAVALNDLIINIFYK